MLENTLFPTTSSQFLLSRPKLIARVLYSLIHSSLYALISATDIIPLQLHKFNIWFHVSVQTVILNSQRRD
jgi:hypothetical protein